ncbi:MAG TPA: response regulator [Nitrospiraceae bacterium]|nr:response regulator [Nitrospiraceae bacterium]
MNAQRRTDTPVDILIAEDSPTQAQQLQHILEEQGYNVTLTTNGRDAFKAAQRHKPTLIISDVVMPEMDGYDLCRRVKSDPGLGDIPIILVTTLSDPQDVIRGLECRADNFILKPYDDGHLLSRVRFVLINREVRQAEQSSMGVEIFFNGQKHFITADRLQILNLLLSTYEAAIQRNKELSLAQDDLHRVNASLEAANKELEAFSYSVSHDLRAPLRAVDGFAQAVLEDYGQRLPEEAQRYLQTIRQGAQRMGDLIDDLLAFAQLSRQPLTRRAVDTGKIVREVLEELSRQRDGRQIEVRVGELSACQGDPGLLRQVWVNLLSNALKFTRKTESAVVEIGSALEQGETIFFVRDNGSGFDMQYAEKLFGVFQRLHREEEFEGTGVGLAIVARVIHRHGGRVWAEAETDRGATFYFTLEGATNNE